VDVIGPNEEPVQDHFIAVSLLFCESVVLRHAITVWSIATCQVTSRRSLVSSNSADIADCSLFLFDGVMPPTDSLDQPSVMCAA